MNPNVVNNFVKVSQERNHVIVKNAGGLQGIPGPAGAGLQIDGSVNTYADLPQHLRPEDAGVAYFVQADGKLYVWSGTRWPADGEGSDFQGPAGQDGYSPTATVTKVGNTATITIRDKDGTTTASISDGTIPVIDDQLDLTSENPVQNKVVTQAINQKQNILQNGSITTNLVADEAVTSPKVDWSSLIDKIYPVGSIYMSVNSTSPATFIGGTWQRIQDTFLMAGGSNYAPGTTGGSASHDHNLSSNGAAAIRNYADTLGFGPGTSLPTLSEQYGASVWTFTHNPDSSSTFNYSGVGLYGKTDSETTLPPYMSVYVWKRTA